MKSIIAFAVLLGMAQFTQAQDWTGAVNSDWNNPANWDGFPTNGDDITISFSNYSGAMAHPVISSNSIFSPAGMLVDGGAVLTINANLTTTDRVEILGVGTQVIQNSGVLNISGGAGNARLVFAEQAQFAMNGGELNVGQRLLFELGGSGEMFAGTIDVAETFAIIDGLGMVSSTFSQSGGFIQTEEFGFENEAGNFRPSYYLSGGTLQVNGTFLVEGVLPGSGLGEFYANDGTANFLGTVGNLAGSTMNFVIRIEDNAVLNMSGATIDQLAGDSIVVANSGTLNINSPLTWNNAGVVTGEDGEVVVNASVQLNGVGEYQFPNLTVLPSNSLTQVTSPLISVNGNFVLGGTYNQLNHALEFNGDNVQNFSFGQNLLLDALIMNNSTSSVVVSGDLTISDSLKWLNGILELNANELIFPDGSVSLQSWENSYAIGRVTKIGNQEFVFPIGSLSNRYRPFGVSAPLSTSTIISVNYHPESYVNTTPVNTPLQTVSSLEYWDVSRTGSSDFVSINAGWNNASASGLTDCASISLAHWDNSSWNLVASIASGLCSGTGSGNLQSTSQIDDFGIFTVGFTEGVYQQVVSVCFGETYSVGNNVYDSTGVYFDQFLDVNGEDSIVVTSLTIEPQLNLGVTANVTNLVSNAEGVNYQWLDCQNNYAAISGAQAQQFYPVQNGIYAVLVELNGCSDTSDCYVIDQLSIQDFAADLLIYPNPVEANGMLSFISNEEFISGVWIAVDGARIPVIFLADKTISSPSESGFYILHLSDLNGRTTKKKISIVN